VTGQAYSGFPTTSGAYQGSFGGGFDDAFLSKFTSSGRLSYSTFLGGNDRDLGFGVTTDGSGDVYVTSGAESGFPTTSGAYQGSSGGNGDAFLSKFNFTTTPNAGFTSDSGCAGKALSFVDTSSQQGSDTINQYDWNFGDGSSDSGQSVSYAYRSAGTYTVELIVTTAEGLKDTATEKAQVYHNPSASFSVNDRDQCLRDSFQFTDQSTISTGSLSSYEWSFGDGNSSQRQNPSHQYSSANSFTVGLLVTSDQGCEDSISQQVMVNPNPSASFSVNDRVQCQRDSFQFTNQSTISTGSLVSYEWSFGDGASSQRQNPSHQYSSADSFTVSLSVTSDQGCEDTASQPVTVNPTPNSSFTFTKKSGGTVAFEAADSTLSNYQWTFGDGNTSIKAKPDHTYTSNGTYKVDLVTTNSTNCRDTTTKTVSISTVGLEEKPNGPDIPFKAYPNPFSRGVTLSYELPAAQSQVALKVVDEQGKVIIRKEQGRQPAGRHTHQLQALQEASPGTYFIRLKLGGYKQQVERVVKVE
jgi:PKD repeat protein